ncbi:ABC transporter permease [Clostridium sp.]|uniref:ABC transporter permease n=1 Tax=Clostridium sp. TaxID=1506 RepID=UPI001A3ECB4B|nr:ABC transporter permease [Clostridium sp.]MBK5242590.1 ABC transporter permease [Clostridium sp.]
MNNKIKKLLKNKNFILGLTISLSVIICAVFADFIAPYPYDEIHILDKLQPPSLKYYFGTDIYGRCIFSRIIFGTRIVLQVGFIVTAIQLVVGVTLGLLAGYYGGKISKFISFITDITWSMPAIVMSLAIVTILGPSLTNVIIAIAFVGWAQYTKIISAKTQTLKNQPFIDAARVLGESDFNIITKYILPNTINQIIILVTLTLPTAVLSTSSLGFLGLGAQPPAPDWGIILSEGVNLIKIAPWISIAPGLSLLYVVLGYNILGEGLKELLDPKFND